MAEIQEAHKARGAFFTPPALARFIVNWAVRSPEDDVLEPSCGEAVFLAEAALAMRRLSGGTSSGRLQGYETHGPSAARGLAALRAQGAEADVSTDSFFDQKARPVYGAVVGNPPFLRYHHFAGAARSAALERSLQAGVRLDGRSNAWAYFVIHAGEFVSPQGRLGLVLPSDLLTSDYAVPVRRYLLERFADVRLITFRRRVFTEVGADALVLLACGRGPATHLKVFEAEDLEGLDHVDDLGWATADLQPTQKWTSALLTDEGADAYLELTREHDFGQFKDCWGKASIGAVTGAVNYFRLTARQARRLHLPESDLLRLYPGWSRVRDTTLSVKGWEKSRSRGEPVYLFYPDPHAASQSPAAAAYIKSGLTDGVDLSGKCEARNPWWRVPLPPVADLFIGNISHRMPVLVANRAGLHHTNTHYGIELDADVRRLGKDLLPIAALNSLSLLGAELVGRSHGRGGLKFAVAEVDAWPVPTPALLDRTAKQLRARRARVRYLVQSGRLLEAASVVDEALFGNREAMPPGLDAVRASLALLQHRRASRGGAKR